MRDFASKGKGGDAGRYLRSASMPLPHGVKTDIINVKLNIYNSKHLILHMTSKFPKLKLLSLPR